MAMSSRTVVVCGAGGFIGGHLVSHLVKSGAGPIRAVDIVEEIAAIRVARRYKLHAPKGVNGRNSDNTRILEHLGWEPRITLRHGLEQTYRWIYDHMKSGRPAVVNGAHA
jgi:nucleoside-diphosphate-sugar epimerase